MFEYEQYNVHQMKMSVILRESIQISFTHPHLDHALNI